MSYGRIRQNRPFYFAATEAERYSPHPSPDRTRLNLAEIIPSVPIPPRGPPRGRDRRLGGSNRKTGKNGPDLTHFSAFKLPGG